jgi:hypothetical protein
VSATALTEQIDHNLCQPIVKSPCWWLCVVVSPGATDDDPALAVGVRGEIGALAWYAGDDELVLVDVLHQYEADCNWTWFGHESPMRLGAEVPAVAVSRGVTR